MTTPSRASIGGSATADRIARHALPDRLFHWISAACVLILLGTAFLPIVGVEFGWVTVHWITGLVLGVAVLFHVVRVLVRGTWGSMWLGRADLADALDVAGATLRRALPTRRPGKYSVAQKLIHHAFTVVVLTTLVDGRPHAAAHRHAVVATQSLSASPTRRGVSCTCCTGSRRSCSSRW